MNDTTTIEYPTAPTADNEGWEWARVEIMGHREHWGRIRQEERYGVKMLRVDIPGFARIADVEIAGDQTKPAELVMTWTTHFYGGSALFGVTLTDEATVMRKNRPYEYPYRLTHRPEAKEVHAIDNQDNHSEDDDVDDNNDDDGDLETY
jgi:hypothetical protein